MKIKIVTIYCFFFLFLCQSIVLSKDFTSEKKDLKDFKYYTDKGNRGEQLTTEEFRLLMQKLENNLLEVKKAFFEISIWGADFSYEIGKAWEFELDMTKQSIENALKFLSAVKEKPNSIGLSVGLHCCLAYIDNEGLVFEKVDHFTKIIKPSRFNLRLWTIAFEKAHLLPLAIAKDKGKDLYEKKK